MAPISLKRHRYPLPRWKYTPYTAKRPGYVPPALREDASGQVNPYKGYRVMDEKLQKRKRGLGGPYTRISQLQKCVTDMMCNERMILPYPLGHETRQYLERIIHTARYGPQDPEAMKLADYYINDKNLIYKLFNVIVPRFGPQHDFGSYTRFYRVPPEGNGLDPGQGTERCVLELVGNPFPALEPAITPPHENNLLNILLKRLRHKFEARYFDELKTIRGCSQTFLHPPNRVDSFYPEHKLDDRLK